MLEGSSEFGLLGTKKTEMASNSRDQKRRREITQESKSVVYIPQELIDSILTRLPLKSLVRFESVCKAWRSSITNPNFLRMDRHFVLLVTKSSTARVYHSIREQQNPFLESLPVFWDERPEKLSNKNEEDQHSRVHVSNSCNGMVLVCVGTCFYLFIPSTRYFVKVLTLNYLDDDHEFDTWGFSESDFDFHGDNLIYKLYIGLYYDETISDYMAVVLIRHGLCESREERYILVEASLKGKRWNHVNNTFKVPEYIIVGPLVNGQLHWLGNTKIIRFDPVFKVFEELPSFQPPSNHIKYCRIVGIGYLEGCLCVSRKFNKNNVEILAMKEYGVSESWTPIYSFSVDKLNSIYGFNPLLLTRAGELFVSTRNQIWVYNLGKKSFERYNLPSEQRSICWVSFCQNIDTPTGYYWNQTEHENFGNTEDFERISKFWKEIARTRSELEDDDGSLTDGSEEFTAEFEESGTDETE